MALTAKDKNILRIIISQGNYIIASRMKDYNSKTDDEILSEIANYKVQQFSLIQEQRDTLDSRENDIDNGGTPKTLPQG